MDYVLGGSGDDQMDTGLDSSRDFVVGDHGLAEFQSQHLPRNC